MCIRDRQQAAHNALFCHDLGTTPDTDPVCVGLFLLQIDFLLDLFQKAKKENIHTVLDTAGNPFTGEGDFFDKFQELMNVTDLILLDLKVYDEKKHRALTGKSNRNILDLAKYLSDIGKPVWIRHVLVQMCIRDRLFL